MALTKVVTKDGKQYNGPIEMWRPEQNWFSIVWADREKVFSFDDVESAITYGDRINVREIGDRDELERARKDLKDGRTYGWEGYPSEKFSWE